jgi:hypothetical protein
LSVTLSVLVPPVNVGVAPTTAPLVPSWIVRLCASGEALVKLIVTVPAFAVSVLFVNLSWPLGSAAIDCEPPAAPLAALVLVLVAVDGAVEVVLAAALDAVVLLLLLLDPPHAASPRTSAAAMIRSAGSLRMCWFLLL